MKLNSLKPVLFMAAFALSGAVLPATAAERMHVAVPFSFLVGNSEMPAGDYTIIQSGNGMVTFSGEKASVMILTVPTDYSNTDSAGLRFSSVDSNHVLTSIQVGGEFSRAVPNRTADHKAILASAR